MLLNRLPRWLQLPDSPLFDYDLKHMRVTRTTQGIINHTRNTILVTLIITIALTCLFAWLWYAADTQINSIYLLPLSLATAGFALLIVGSYTEIIPTLAAILFAVGLINQDMRTDRIDLLRITVGEQHIVNARHGVAIAKAWRFMVIWIVARAVSMMCFILAILPFVFRRDVYVDLLEIPPEYLSDVYITLAIWLPIIGFSTLIAVIEPIWRLRMLSGMGIWVSSQVEGRATAVLLGIVAWLVLNTGIGIALNIISLPFGILFGVGSILLEENIDLVPLFFRILMYGIIPVISILTVPLMWFLYRIITRWFLDEAVKRLVRR